MATIEWKNTGSTTNTAAFDTANAWSGGVVPVAGDTAVISSSGDGAPSLNQYTGILSPSADSSNAYLCGPTLYTQTLEHTTENGRTTYFYVTPQESTVPTGETIDPSVLDLIGAGSEAALTLQNSIIASPTVNVSGDAYIYASYTDTVKGNISIGAPFSVNGKPVTSSTSDAHGFKNALYIDTQMWGSWSGALTPNGYVPGVTSDGTISVAGASALWVSVAGYPQQIKTVGTVTHESAASVSAFTNVGAIHVSAGGSLHVSAYGGLGELINKGSILIDGGAGDVTVAQVQAAVEGAGTWVLDGLTNTNPGYTGAVFGNYVLGQTFKIDGATLYADGGSGTAVNNWAFSGGTVDFTGTSGALLISVGYLQTALPFSDTIEGFGRGDQINLSLGLLPGDTLKPVLNWHASTNTLSLTAYVDNGLSTTSTLDAAFKFAGSYNLSDFSVSTPVRDGTQVDLTIETSASNAVPALPPADWGIMRDLGLSDAIPQEASSVSYGSANAGTGVDMLALGHLDLAGHCHGFAFAGEMIGGHAF
jgi:hypothetical protein